MFREIIFLETTTSENVSSFIKNELYIQFYNKVGQALLQNGAGLIYYKVGQVLQSGAGIRNWGNYYKLGQYLIYLATDNLLPENS